MKIRNPKSISEYQKDRETISRSDKYQYMYREIPGVPISEMFGNEGRLDIEIKELKLDIVEAVLKLIDGQLTSRQKEILELWMQGLTTVEISDRLGVIQPTIWKSLNGGQDFSAPGKPEHGGLFQRIKVIVENEAEIINKLYQLYEIDPEMGLPGSRAEGLRPKRNRYKPRKPGTGMRATVAPEVMPEPVEPVKPPALKSGSPER